MSNKVDAETAEVEFKRFADCMDLDIDPAGLDEEERKNLKEVKAPLIKAIQNGSAVVNDDGEIIFTPKIGSQGSLTFREPTGATPMAFDKRKPGEDISKMYAGMAQMTKVDPSTFARMVWRDLKVCTSIFNLFFG